MTTNEDADPELQRTVLTVVNGLFLAVYALVSGALAWVAMDAVAFLDVWLTGLLWLIGFLIFVLATLRVRERELRKRGLE